MGFVKWVIGGLIGGVVGAAIWAAITHYAHAEVGWIAWGIGFIVGFCVRMAAGEEDGFGPGITAVVIACLSIVAGKFIAISMMVSSLAAGGASPVVPNDMIRGYAHRIVVEREAKAEKVAWPANMNAEAANKLEDYPVDVQQAANKQWTDLPADQQTQQIATRQQEMNAIHDMIKGVVRQQAFAGSFGPYDILWFILAALTAFKLGSGASSDD